MTAKHTPGPWIIDGGTNENNDLFIWKDGEYEGGHAIATIHGEIQEGSEANARLTAAAPALLAACKWTARGEHHRACSHRKNPNTCDCYVGACKSAISAGEKE